MGNILEAITGGVEAPVVDASSASGYDILIACAGWKTRIGLYRTEEPVKPTLGYGGHPIAARPKTSALTEWNRLEARADCRRRVAEACAPLPVALGCSQLQKSPRAAETAGGVAPRERTPGAPDTLAKLPVSSSSEPFPRSLHTR